MLTPSHCARLPSLRLRLLAAAASLATFLGPPVAAQQLDLLLSFSADGQLPTEAVADEEIVLHRFGELPRVTWPSGCLALALGNTNAQGLLPVPGDVDALHDRGLDVIGGGLLLSFISDQGSFKDGDVLALDGSSLVVMHPEGDLVTALGVTDGNLDVDALHLEQDGSLLFSLAEDENSSVLSGDNPGVLQDGDVLRWDPVTGGVSMVLTESQVTALVIAAIAGPATPGDVKGLARDPSNGELLFSVQSPSAFDASVFSTAGGGTLVAGHEELDLGFLGAVELDALSLAVSIWPSLTTTNARPAAGESFELVLRGAEPGEVVTLVLGLDFVPTWWPLLGWGGLSVPNDVLFGVSLSAMPWLSRVVDTAGVASWAQVVPPGQFAEDVVVQVVTFGWPMRTSNPAVLELVQ